MRTTTPIPKAVLPVVLVILLFSLQAATAFYDPSLQRWLSRDPLDESGFEAIRRYDGQYGETEGNQYTFLRNSAVNITDPLGLTAYKCSPADTQAIQQQLEAACKAAKNGNCFKCWLSSEGASAMENFCNNVGTIGDTHTAGETVVVCHGSGDKNCSGGSCGWTGTISRRVHVCMANSRCPSAGCTALHEAAHSVGGVGRDYPPTDPKADLRAYRMEQCAGCRP